MPNTGNVIVSNNRIQGNYAGDAGGGIQESNRNVTTILDNQIMGNTGRNIGGGLFVGRAECSGNLIVDNTALSAGAGVYALNAHVHHNTICRNTIGSIIGQAAGIEIDYGTLDHNIVANNRSNSHDTGIGIVIGDYFSTGVVVFCNDAWGNDGGDYEARAAYDQTGGANFSLDPLFCSLATNDFTLDTVSPCASGAGCGLIGAYPATCRVVPTLKRTWGQLKRRFR